MFNLEEATVDWGRRMLAAGIQTPVPLDELEAHLREEVEKQLSEGLSERQAFEIAVRRIGEAGKLKLEFKKVNDAKRAQRRKRAGFALGGIFAVYSITLSYLLFRNGLTFNERLLGLASVATTLLSVYVVWEIMPRFVPIIANRIIQSAVGIMGGISGAGWFLAFAYLILPRFDFTQGQLLVAISWALVPTLVLPQTAFLLIDKSESQEPPTTCS